MKANEKEELRHVVLEILATRHPAALAANVIWRRAAMEVDFTIEEPDVFSALEFLKGLNAVEENLDGFGSTRYWSATSQGILMWERGRKKASPKTRE